MPAFPARPVANTFSTAPMKPQMPMPSHDADFFRNSVRFDFAVTSPAGEVGEDFTADEGERAGDVCAAGADIAEVELASAAEEGDADGGALVTCAYVAEDLVISAAASSGTGSP